MIVDLDGYQVNHQPFIVRGYLEKNLLNELQIPCVNLEDFGCPKVEKLIAMGFDVGLTCGRHAKPTHHCLQQETYLFYQWIQSQA